MLKQQTLAIAADQSESFDRYRRQTRRDEFLVTMERVVPWAELCAVIEPFYPKAGNGRPPVRLARMLRMYFVRHWFNLVSRHRSSVGLRWPSKRIAALHRLPIRSVLAARCALRCAPMAACSLRHLIRDATLADEACEEALLDSVALRRFVGIYLGCARVPDGTTLLKFRRLLEQHDLGAALFAQVGQVLQDKGMKLGTGTIVDATAISALSSTKNAEGERDPEMHQTCKGQQWYFGMKLHIGVDSKTGLAHSAVVTAAHVHDKHPLPQLLHRAEQEVYGDSAYASQQDLIGSKARWPRTAPMSA
ncbi:transposase, IS4 family [Verminephrobacter eiseniae EF01-2]|uniref:Transposase, IS4 family n=1 Tax=Verminephrobacter eiseniae (strain EF01-2) TaxID=391735 RepID=A1WHE4_VEREI|nr:transposase, IS4 family [Verminephrobacter eiseniae EF01-2]